MSAAKGGGWWGGVWKMLTFGDKGGGGDMANADITEKNICKTHLDILIIWVKYWIFVNNKHLVIGEDGIEYAEKTY